MDMVQRYICDIVSQYLNMDTNEFLEFVIDDQLHMDLLSAFTKKDTGKKCVLFYYQLGPPFGVGEFLYLNQ